MMRFTDIVSLSFLNLRLHKTRSLLTSLGVIFGVGSVISMMAISKGAERSALSQIESMGIDKIIIYTKKPHFDTSGGGSSGRGAATSSVEDYGLDVRDYQFIRTMENVHHITTIRNTRQPITRKGGIEPQESPWKFSSVYPHNQSLPTLLLCALTYTSDFTGGYPPPPLSEKELT